ncbi:MAG: peptidylprolyl isomerase [Phycisphaerales bacterium]
MKKLIPIAVLALGAAVFAAVAFAQPSTESKEPVAEVTTQPTEEEAVQEDTMVYVEMVTSKGTMYIALNETKAPISTANFLSYVDDNFYDNTVFHRVIKGFMIQGGGFAEGLKKKQPKAGIKNEWTNGLKNTRGTIAMARLGNQPDSGTSQFFINLADNGFLDQPRDGAGYAVFGHLVKGEDVLDAIGNATTSPQGMHGDVPVDPITIETVSKLSEEKALELGLTEAEG